MSKYTDLKNWYAPHEVMGDFITTRVIHWEIGRRGSGLTFRVPPDFVFDCSVPWFLTWLFDPLDGRFMKASALHDRMISTGWDRPTAAGVFNDALSADGVGKLKRFAMFLAVAVWRWS